MLSKSFDKKHNILKLTPDELEKRLKNALLAETLESLCRLGYKLYQADGVWPCCCGHENNLVHYAGTFPFKYLTCGSCEHIICSDCRTSEVLTPLAHVPDADALLERELAEKHEVRLCTMCPTFGLSFRVEKRGRCFYVPEKCYCGNKGGNDWPHFYMGSISVFRQNPPLAQHNAKNELTIRKLEIARYGKLWTEASWERKQQDDAAQLAQEAAEQRSQEAKKLQARSAIELQAQHEQRAQLQPQRRARPASLLTAHPKQETHWPPPSSAPLIAPLRPRLPAIQRLAVQDSSPKTCSLQRSGAVRGRSSGPRTPRSETFDDQTQQNKDYFALRRAETMATADEHERLHTQSSALLKSRFGIKTYNAMVDTPQEEEFMSIAREELAPQILGEDQSGLYDPVEQAQAFQRKVLARARTDDV